MEAALAPDVRARTYVVGASVTGPGHVRRGVTCQDRFAAEVLDDGTVLLAVSDGLGAAPHAAIGAETAAGAAVRAGTALMHAARDFPAQDLARHMLSCARARLCTVAEAMGSEPPDLACTLITLVGNTDAIAAAHIGDGAVIVEHDHGFSVLSGPPEREYVNEVEPLTAADWTRHVRIKIRPGIRSVAILTDGCQHAAIAPDGSVGPGFVPAVVGAVRDGDAGEDEMRALLTGAKISEHSDDDKTLVVAILA